MDKQKKIETNNNTTIFIAYCGDFKKNIGPPTSMLGLYNLLKRKYRVAATKQLTNQKNLQKKCNVNTNKNKQSSNLKQKIRETIRKSALGEILADIRLLYLLLEFNIILNYKIYHNVYDIIIITQPFFVSIFRKPKYNLIYIRRANEPDNVLIATSRLKRIFEKLFLKFTKFKTVYLVPLNNQKADYSVIPNHFEQDNHTLNYRTDSKLQGACVGTWNWRKGADRLLELSRADIFNGDINVFGTLGTERDLNDKLMSSNINYKGLTERPYDNFFVGDVYFSLSRLEGLQRSMIEALFQGCIVVAARRPDSESLIDFPGVYIIDWIDNQPNDSMNNIQACITFINELDLATRISLGEQNRNMAIKNFSSNEVLSKWSEVIHKDFRGDI